MSGNYWSNVPSRRLNRRRTLAAGSHLALGAVLLAACGGDDGARQEETSSLIVAPVDETKKAVRGGTYRSSVGTDVSTFDPYTTNQGVLNRVYSQFFHIKGGLMAQSKGEIEGDLAESWELSPDKLQLTIKLNTKAHFAPLPPVNGRAPDSRDVTFSYERLKAIGTRRGELANDLNPQAPVQSLTAPDDRTVIIKFVEPFSTAPYLFANWTSVLLFIVPREAAEEKVLDLRRGFLGTGPWYLSEYQPSLRFVYMRNPGFGQDPRGVPYMEKVETPIIAEYAQGLAQFKAGALHTWNVRAEDLLQTKRDAPALELMAAPPPTGWSSGAISTAQYRNIYGWLAESPFRDERVRQAWSMSWDRDLYIDVTYNVSKFQAEGLPMETRWNTAFQAETFEGQWLDPKGKDFGPNAKYFQHNLAEAKKLLSAAGHPNGLDANCRYSISTGYGQAYSKAVEIITGMAQEASFRIKNFDINFNTEFANVFRAPGGKFEGASFIQSFSTGLDPAAYLFRFYNSQGSDFRGFDADGKGNSAGDPVMDDLTNKMKREFDEKRRTALVHDLQRHEAQKHYITCFPGGANSFALAWPAVRGRQVWRGEGQRDDATLWLDQTKPPFKAS